MKLSNQAVVAAAPDAVFALLNDPERIVGCLPGAKLTGREGDAWAGGVTVKVGPITVSYGGTVRFDEVDEAARRLRLVARGSESRGSGDAEADVVLVVQATPDGHAQLDIQTDLLIRGKLAQFGKGAIATVSDRILAQFAANLGALATGGAPGPAAPAAAGAPAGPRAAAPASAPAPRTGAELDGWGLLVRPWVEQHGRQTLVVAAALLQGYVWGRAVTIERWHRRALR